MKQRLGAIAVLMLTTGTLPGSAAAQQDCKMLLCSPRLTLRPSLLVEPLGDRTRVARLRAGAAADTVREERLHEFAFVLQLEIPSTIPRTGFVLEAWWLPFRDAERNRITGYEADSLGASPIDRNLPTLELGLAIELLDTGQTGGWLALELGLVDQFGPAARPGDESEYTHELDLELEATFGVLEWLAEDNWFRNIRAYTAVDFQLTGVPEAGERVPRDERILLEDVGRWSLWVGLDVPIAPIAP